MLYYSFKYFKNKSACISIHTSNLSTYVTVLRRDRVSQKEGEHAAFSTTNYGGAFDFNYNRFSHDRYRVFTYFRLDLMWFSKAICYEGMILFWSRTKGKRVGWGKGGIGFGGEENMEKQSIMFSNCGLCKKKYYHFFVIY